MKELFNNILTFSSEIHNIAVSHGFWENATTNQKLMLIISELGEALEADRKGRYCHNVRINNILQINNHEFFQESFDEYVKDTFEDEIVDSIIRVLDLGVHLKIHFKLEENYSFIKNEETSNIPDCLFELTKSLIVYQPEFGLNYFLNQILYYSLGKKIKLNTDLLIHIQAKIRYNSLRSYKHNKAY